MFRLNLKILTLLWMWSLARVAVYMGEARNAMLEALHKKTAPATGAEWFGLMTAGTNVKTWKSISNKTLEKAHTFETGDIVLLNALAGGAAGTAGALKNGHFYYVKKVSATVIELSETSTFVAIVWGTEVTEAEFTRYTEVTGAPYKRIKAEWNAAASSLQEDTKSHSVPCAEGTVVDAILVASQEAAGGTIHVIEKVAKETVGAAKAYVISNAKDDLLTE